jgi:hypothetical protein
MPHSRQRPRKFSTNSKSIGLGYTGAPNFLSNQQTERRVMKTVQKKRKYSGIEKKISHWGIVFVLPAILFFSVFSFYPILKRALHEPYSTRGYSPWLHRNSSDSANYTYLFRSASFWNSMRATIVFTLGTFVPPPDLQPHPCCPHIPAMKKGKRFFQMANYAPAVFLCRGCKPSDARTR